MIDMLDDASLFDMIENEYTPGGLFGLTGG